MIFFLNLLLNHRVHWLGHLSTILVVCRSFLGSYSFPIKCTFQKYFLFMWPKYDSCCFFVNASSQVANLASSITDSFVLLTVHGIRSNLLQHHNSKLSICLLSVFLSIIIHFEIHTAQLGKLTHLLFGTLLQFIVPLPFPSYLALFIPNRQLTLLLLLREADI